MALRCSLPARVGYECGSPETLFVETPSGRARNPIVSARESRNANGVLEPHAFSRDQSRKRGTLLFPEGQRSTKISVHLGCPCSQPFRQWLPIRQRGPFSLVLGRQSLSPPAAVGFD